MVKLFDNLPINLKARISSEDYQEAVDAHKLKKNIQITGILRKMTSQYKFVDIHLISVP